MDRGEKKYVAGKPRAPFKNDQDKQRAYTQLFESEEAQKVLVDMLIDAGWFDSFTPEYSDNGAAAHFFLGKQFFCRSLLNLLSYPVEGITDKFENLEPEGIEL